MRESTGDPNLDAIFRREEATLTQDISRLEGEVAKAEKRAKGEREMAQEAKKNSPGGWADAKYWQKMASISDRLARSTGRNLKQRRQALADLNNAARRIRRDREKQAARRK